MSPSTRRWDFTFAAESQTKGGRTNDGPHGSALPKPPGFSEQTFEPGEQSKVAQRNKEQQLALKTKKAWELAVSPGGQFAMNGFMLWMSGNQPNIFSIMITSYVMYNPLKSIMSANATFARFGDIPITLPKLVFILINLAVCAFGVLKMSWLGLLPTEPADWISFYRVRPSIESVSGGMPIA